MGRGACTIALDYHPIVNTLSTPLNCDRLVSNTFAMFPNRCFHTLEPAVQFNAIQPIHLSCDQVMVVCW